MTRHSPLFALVLAATIFTADAALAEATPEGAAAIRDELQSWIDRQIAAAGPEAVVRLDGEVTVTPEGDAYQALVPSVEVEAGGSIIRFDAIPVDIAPRADGWYDVGWVLPEAVIATSDGVDGRLTVEEQSIAGIFAPEVRSFMSLDVEALDVALLPTDGATGGVTLDRLLVEATNHEDDYGVAGSYRLYGRFAMEGLTFDAPGQHFSAGVMEFRIGRAGVVLAEWAAFKERLDAITAEAGDATAADMMADVLEQSDAFLSDFYITYGLKNVVLETPDLNLAVPDFVITGHAGDLRDPLAGFDILMDLPGFTADTPTPDPFQHMMPTVAHISMELIDIPADPLNRLVVEWLRGMNASAGDPRLMIEAVEELMASESGRLEVVEISLANAIGEASLHAELHPAPESVLGVTGFGEMTIKNLDELIAEVQGVRAGHEPETALIFLRGLGTPTTTAEGGIVQAYDLEITHGGQVLVNGTDMMEYGYMGGPAARSAHEAPPPATNPKLPSAPVGPPAAAPGLK